MKPIGGLADDFEPELGERYSARREVFFLPMETLARQRDWVPPRSAVKAAAVLACAGAYWFPVRRWFSRWGTTPEELARAMPGDALIADPTKTDTHAVTVHAPAESIWPWLVQIGHQRGGLYSYDWLDRLFGFLDRPSARRILPEYQQLAVGDTVLLGRERLTVAVLEPPRALVLSYRARGMEWVWQFGLYPLDDEHTRLISRGIERVPRTPWAWLGMRIMEPAAFVMTRRMLLGVKERAETLRRSREPIEETSGETSPEAIVQSR